MSRGNNLSLIDTAGKPRVIGRRDVRRQRSAGAPIKFRDRAGFDFFNCSILPLLQNPKILMGDDAEVV